MKITMKKIISILAVVALVLTMPTIPVSAAVTVISGQSLTIADDAFVGTEYELDLATVVETDEMPATITYAVISAVDTVPNNLASEVDITAGVLTYTPQAAQDQETVVITVSATDAEPSTANIVITLTVDTIPTPTTPTTPPQTPGELDDGATEVTAESNVVDTTPIYVVTATTNFSRLILDPQGLLDPAVNDGTKTLDELLAGGNAGKVYFYKDATGTDEASGYIKNASSVAVVVSAAFNLTVSNSNVKVVGDKSGTNVTNSTTKDMNIYLAAIPSTVKVDVDDTISSPTATAIQPMIKGTKTLDFLLAKAKYIVSDVPPFAQSIDAAEADNFDGTGFLWEGLVNKHADWSTPGTISLDTIYTFRAAVLEGVDKDEVTTVAGGAYKLMKVSEGDPVFGTPAAVTGIATNYNGATKTFTVTVSDTAVTTAAYVIPLAIPAGATKAFYQGDTGTTVVPAERGVLNTAGTTITIPAARMTAAKSWPSGTPWTARLVIDGTEYTFILKKA